MVEVEEIQENGPPKVGILDGEVQAHNVWLLPLRRRIKVHLNEFDQPIRKGGLVFMHFLSDLSKDGLYCPIGGVSWPNVSDHYKLKIIDLVWAKFVLPYRAEIDERILIYVNKKWRHHKYELHRDYCLPNLSKESIIKAVPPRVLEDQWVSLVEYWFSDNFEKQSKKGAIARSCQLHQRTTGSKSSAQKKIEYVELHGREPSSLEFWEVTHKKKGGGYVEGTCTQEFMDIANSKVDELVAKSEKPRALIENEVFNEMMYSEDNQKQGLVGHGVGIKKSQVYGINGHLKRRYNNVYANNSSEVMEIKSVLETMQKRTDSLEKRNEELVSRNEELVSSNDELRKRNDMLAERNDQIDAQLKCMSSLLEKLSDK